MTSKKLMRKMLKTMGKATQSNIVTDERLAKYFDYTKRALAEASAALNSNHVKIAAEFLDISEFANSGMIKKHSQKKGGCIDCMPCVFLDMASRYYSDAHHFHSKGDVVTAFAALNYAHGWLDAGARAGFFLVKNNELFVVD